MNFDLRNPVVPPLRYTLVIQFSKKKMSSKSAVGTLDRGGVKRRTFLTGECRGTISRTQPLANRHYRS